MCIDDKKVHYKRGYYGNNKYEIPFIDSKREGVAKWYYVNGNIKQEVPYIQDQIMERLRQRFHTVMIKEMG